MQRREVLMAAVGGLGATAVVGESRIKPPLQHGETLKAAPVIRVWKLGSLEHRIFPSEEAIQRLADCLRQQEPGSDTDIIWGPELNVEWLPAGAGVNLVTGPGVSIRKVDETTYVVEARTAAR